MLDLKQRKPQAFVTRCTEEKIAGFNDRADLWVTQRSMKRHVRLLREPSGISAPSHTPDDV